MDTDQIEFLNLEVHWQDIIGIPIRNDIPKELQSYLQKLVERTVPIISIIFPDDYCWQWVGAIDKDGYAKHRIPGGYKGSTLVHRFIYQVAVAFPNELTIDHACGNKGCINLRHLRLLPRDLNLRYGDHRKLYNT